MRGSDTALDTVFNNFLGAAGAFGQSGSLRRSSVVVGF
jgi:hypothetical protein